MADHGRYWLTSILVITALGGAWLGGRHNLVILTYWSSCIVVVATWDGARFGGPRTRPRRHRSQGSPRVSRRDGHIGIADGMLGPRVQTCRHSK